jgi:hypothetical protein
VGRFHVSSGRGRGTSQGFACGQGDLDGRGSDPPFGPDRGKGDIPFNHGRGYMAAGAIMLYSIGMEQPIWKRMILQEVRM